MKHFAFLFLFLTTFCFGADEWESDYPLLAGNYQIIGQQHESGKLYSGTIIIEEIQPNHFTVKRTIDGKTVTGTGKVVPATSDKASVFRITFTEDDTEMEGTLLWRSDLDNDGRISGYIYPKGYKGDKPGLLALFAKKGSR